MGAVYMEEVIHFLISRGTVDRDGVIMGTRKREPASSTASMILSGFEEEIAPIVSMGRH